MASFKLSSPDEPKSINAGTGLIYSDGVWQATVSIDPTLLEKIDNLERNMEKIMERMAILDEPDPKRLEEFKTLKDLYDKYKFADALCGKE